jgi:hypothetical protein
VSADSVTAVRAGQRLSSILIPPIMGGIADRFGTSQSFLIYAALILPLCGLLALICREGCLA